MILRNGSQALRRPGDPAVETGDFGAGGPVPDPAVEMAQFELSEEAPDPAVGMAWFDASIPGGKQAHITPDSLTAYAKLPRNVPL